MKKVLCILQLPPPIHGVSLMNSHIIKSNKINSSIIFKTIDLKFSKTINELEKFSLSKVFRSLRYLITITQQVFTFRPCIVYFTVMPTGFAFYRDAVYLILLKTIGQRVLIHLHGKGIKENSASYFKSLVYKFSFANTSVICLSERLSLDIATIYSGKPFIVNNGIESRPKRNNSQSISKSTHSAPPRILFLSNFKKDKGILILLEALRILNDKGVHFTAHLVGAESSVTNAMIKQFLSEKMLTDKVFIQGPLFGLQKIAELESADLFVFPTFNDAFPLVALEAMQFELPIISTFEGSIPDIVINNETGFLVPQHSIGELAEKMEILINDKGLRVKMGLKAGERFRNNYTLEHFEHNMMSVFDTVCKQSPIL